MPLTTFKPDSSWKLVENFKHKNETVIINGKKFTCIDKYEKKVGILARIFLLVLASFTFGVILLNKTLRKACLKGKRTEKVVIPKLTEDLTRKIVLDHINAQKRIAPPVLQQVVVPPQKPVQQVPAVIVPQQNQQVQVPVQQKPQLPLVPAQPIIQQNIPAIVPAPVKNSPEIEKLKNQINSLSEKIKELMPRFEKINNIKNQLDSWYANLNNKICYESRSKELAPYLNARKRLYDIKMQLDGEIDETVLEDMIESTNFKYLNDRYQKLEEEINKFDKMLSLDEVKRQESRRVYNI